ELRDRHVARVRLVSVERRAVAERDHEARVVGSLGADDVLTNPEVDDSVQVPKRVETLAAVCARRGVDVLLVPQADDVHARQISSPSMSSSATSTTTLWT